MQLLSCAHGRKPFAMRLLGAQPCVHGQGVLKQLRQTHVCTAHKLWQSVYCHRDCQDFIIYGSLPSKPSSRPTSTVLCAGLLSAEEKAEWQRHNPSPLIRAFRQMSSLSGWLSRGVAALAETPLGGRILFDAVVKSAAGECIHNPLNAKPLLDVQRVRLVVWHCSRRRPELQALLASLSRARCTCRMGCQVALVCLAVAMMLEPAFPGG